MQADFYHIYSVQKTNKNATKVLEQPDNQTLIMSLTHNFHMGQLINQSQQKQQQQQKSGRPHNQVKNMHKPSIPQKYPLVYQSINNIEQYFSITCDQKFVIYPLQVKYPITVCPLKNKTLSKCQSG